MKRFTLSTGVIILYILTIPILNFNHHKYNGESGVIIWDIKSYYAYLPATVIYKDLSLGFMDENPEKFSKWLWPITTPTGDKAILTTMGLSVMYSPFFFVAHGFALSNDRYEADGYSYPYHIALTFSVYFYFILSLVILRKLLKKHFTEPAISLTLLAVAAGTNLLHYLTLEAPMSHGYSFFLIVLFLFVLERWRENFVLKYIISLGFIAGLISLIRPSNALVIILIPLYEVTSGSSLRKNFLALIKHWPQILVFAVCGILVWLPQLFYWHNVSGKFFYFSYSEVDSSFFFNHPRIFNVLFSYKKGWFVYTPIMLLATSGIYFLIKQKNPFSWAVMIYFILNLYILSSWWSWWFGGGYSNRAFIDSYGLMAFPLAALLNQFRKSKITTWTLSGLVIILIAYNIFQSQQYRRGTIHWFWMNKEAYWEGFLTLNPTCKYWNILNQPDVQMARRGKYEAIPIPDDNISREDLYEFIESELLDDNLLNDSLSTVSVIEGSSFEQLKEDYINSYIDKGEAKDEYRILRIRFLKNKIKNCASWRKEIERKAKRKGISSEEIADQEANRIFEKYSQKYIIQ